MSNKLWIRVEYLTLKTFSSWNFHKSFMNDVNNLSNGEICMKYHSIQWTFLWNANLIDESFMKIILKFHPETHLLK